MIDRDAFRGLPAVGALIEHEVLACAVRTRGRAAVVRAVRAAIEEAREGLRAGRRIAADLLSLAGRSIQILERERVSIRPVINATGVLLHTGLGRAPLAREAIEAVAAVARGYCNLELDLEDGERGRRTTGIERLIRELTGAEAATAVNNNAGATVLVLKALAAGREVIVSRGELVEIGGSFRLPEILEASGAKLREVGTTNKTRLADYERAIGPETAAILRVHRSNFEIVGFTERPSYMSWYGWPMIGGSGRSTTSARERSIPTGFLRRPLTSRRPLEASGPGRTWCCFRVTSCSAGPSAA